MRVLRDPTKPKSRDMMSATPTVETSCDSLPEAQGANHQKPMQLKSTRVPRAIHLAATEPTMRFLNPHGAFRNTMAFKSSSHVFVLLREPRKRLCAFYTITLPIHSLLLAGLRPKPAPAGLRLSPSLSLPEVRTLPRVLRTSSYPPSCPLQLQPTRRTKPSPSRSCSPSARFLSSYHIPSDWALGSDTERPDLTCRSARHCASLAATRLRSSRVLVQTRSKKFKPGTGQREGLNNKATHVAGLPAPFSKSRTKP